MRIAAVPIAAHKLKHKERIKMSKGKFGIHGGQFVPETLMNAVNEFEVHTK